MQRPCQQGPLPGRAAHAAVAILLIGVLMAPAAAAQFPVPAADGSRTWEAEAARAVGPIQTVTDPAASARAFADSAAQRETTLEFPFRTAEATTLAIRPVWWRTGQQRPARLYPYPLSPEPGPGALDRLGDLVFFTAPQAGRVGVVNARTGRVLGPVEVGGYLTDLVADPQARRCYVADALGDRIIILDAGGRPAAPALRTPPEPWSLALHEGTLYVACRAAKMILAIDVASGRTLRSVPTVVEPVGVELLGEPPTALAVRFQQRAFGALDLASEPADQLQYEGPGPATSVIAKYWDVKRGNWSQGKRYARARAHTLLVIDGKDRTEVDVSAVTAAAPLSRETVAAPLDDPGPARFAVCGDYVFFTSPATGRVGAIAAATNKLAAVIDIGGHLSDLAGTEVPGDESPGMVYAADATGHRVVGIDAKTLKLAHETRVPARPCSLAYFSEARIQRKWLEAGVTEVPAIRVQRVYVACAGANQLVALDAASGRVRGSVPLPAPPRFVRRVDMPNPSWWNGMPDDRVEFALRLRVAVETAPVLLTLGTLADTGQPVHDLPEALPRRHRLTVPAGGDETVAVRGDQPLLLGLDERWVDVSSLADPQLAPPRGLTPRDTVGSITVAVDDGPEVDWSRGVWQNPANQMFLVAGTPEYWECNAPTFRVRPGRHVLRVRLRDAHVRLDALEITRSPRPWLQARLQPEPAALHRTVPLPSYQGLFYDDEPVAFSVHLTSTAPQARRARMAWTLRNYMDEVVDEGRTFVEVSPRQPLRHDLRFAPSETGRFTLTLRLETDDGAMTETVRFVRLPQLEHPRLFVRKDELPAVRQVVSQYPALFKRYVQWLQRMTPRQGDWRTRFLPPGLTHDEMAAATPAEAPETGHQRVLAYGWRMYEAGWRMDAALFAAMYLAPQVAPEAREALLGELKPLLEAKQTSYYCINHFHGPLFPGAVAALVDMAPDATRQSMPLYKYLRQFEGRGDVLPWWLVTIEEPVTPKTRAMIYKLAIFESNLERYFATHQPERGGQWWLTTFTGCQCPMQGIQTTFVYLSNLFDEPRLFEKSLFDGYVTLHEYLDPVEDKRKLMPARRGPLAEPWRWIMTALTRHPLEARLYGFDDWVRQLNGPLPNEGEAVDRLMALEGMPYVGPIRGGQDHFTTAVAVPVALALGWYRPGVPTVQRQEMPPTTLFATEGWTVMRSGWDAPATEVYFVSGVREHGVRAMPNHFMVWRGGEALIGWPALWPDDGNNTPGWGNAVVAGDAWEDRWRINLILPRDAEHLVINRFTKPTWSYITRDGYLTGYVPSEGGIGGGLNLHGHTQTPYRREGQTIAYQTRPEWDYVAGDAANAWTTDEIVEDNRQMLFLKPDTVVVYDRVRLGDGARTSALVLAVGREVAAQGDGFTVRAGDSSLRGTVLLPRQARLSTPDPYAIFKWKEQKLLRIEPSRSGGRWVEYLTVMRTGGPDLPALPAQLIADEGTAGVAVTASDGRRIAVRFARPGRPVGGEVVVGTGAAAQRHVLPQTIEDTYAHWAADPRYRAWTTQERFRFVVPDQERPRGE